MKKVVFFLIGVLLLVGCGVAPWRGFAPGPMMNPDAGWWGSGNYASNGERIYFTAANEDGKRISYTSGSVFGGMGGMMGGNNLSCASCHGPDGRGGTHAMHMDVMDAPDIRYDTLSGEVEEHGVDQHTDAHGEYDLEDFYQAVIEGKHPDGESLSRDMPRWQMNDDDLDDLFEFIKSLP